MDLVTPLPLATIDFAPWCVVLATALMASVVNITTRKMANPIVLSLWFCGLAYATWLGQWNAIELNLGMVVLGMPQAVIVVMSNRKAEQRTNESTEGSGFTGRTEPASEAGYESLERPTTIPHATDRSTDLDTGTYKKVA